MSQFVGVCVFVRSLWMVACSVERVAGLWRVVVAGRSTVRKAGREDGCTMPVAILEHHSQ